MQHLEGLPLMTFETQADLRAWLAKNHTTSSGAWVKIAKRGSQQRTVSFEELLDEGLCFGWSESKRRAHDAEFYLQRFTPRSKPGTTSQRNVDRARELVASGRMTENGLKALGLKDA